MRLGTSSSIHHYQDSWRAAKPTGIPIFYIHTQRSGAKSTYTYNNMLAQTPAFRFLQYPNNMRSLMAKSYFIFQLLPAAEPIDRWKRRSPKRSNDALRFTLQLFFYCLPHFVAATSWVFLPPARDPSSIPIDWCWWWFHVVVDDASRVYRVENFAQVEHHQYHTNRARINPAAILPAQVFTEVP